MTIQVIQYQNTTDDEMILLLDEANDKAESMTKAEYDRRQLEHLTKNPTEDVE